MNVFGYDGAGLQYDIFLNLRMQVSCRLKTFVLTVRANGRSFHRNGLINPFRHRPLPSRMTERGSPFRRRFVRRSFGWFFIRLEFQPVLLCELCLEIGILFFQLPVPFLQRVDILLGFI
jgi:hypothetical protein